MTVSRNETAVMSGTAIAPTNPVFESALAGSNSTSGERSQMVFSSGGGEVYGFRVTLPSPMNLSARKWFNFIGYYENYGFLSQIDTLANSGCSIFLFDSSGNYKKWNWHGNQFDNRTLTEGGWPQYNEAAFICVDTGYTPVASSGTLDMSDIAGFEVHVNVQSSLSSTLFAVYRVMASNSLQVYGGTVGNETKFKDISDALVAWPDPAQPKHLLNLTAGFFGQAGISYSCRKDLEVGDGSTTTKFLDSGFSLSFYPSQDVAVTGGSGGMPHAVCGADSRFFKVNLSASDSIKFLNGRWSGHSSKQYRWECAGSGECIVSGNTFFNAIRIQPRQAQFINTQFINCSEVEVLHNSTITNCTYVSGSAKGLYIVGGPDDYSHINVALQDTAAAVHVTIADGAAGSYDLTGLTSAGQTVVFHNESTTAAVTIYVRSGFGATSTTTAGGAITISQPPATVTITALDAVTKAPIVGAAVYIEAASGGSIPAGTEIMNTTTNASGIATAAVAIGGDQPIQHSSVRKASSAPHYTPAYFEGPISALNGLNVTVLMNSED